MKNIIKKAVFEAYGDLRLWAEVAVAMALVFSIFAAIIMATGALIKETDKRQCSLAGDLLETTFKQDGLWAWECFVSTENGYVPLENYGDIDQERK